MHYPQEISFFFGLNRIGFNEYLYSSDGNYGVVQEGIGCRNGAGVYVSRDDRHRIQRSQELIAQRASVTAL